MRGMPQTQCEHVNRNQIEIYWYQRWHKWKTRIELEWDKFEIIIHLADKNEILLSWNAVDIQLQQTKAMFSSFWLIESRERYSFAKMRIKAFL